MARAVAICVEPRSDGLVRPHWLPEVTEIGREADSGFPHGTAECVEGRVVASVKSASVFLLPIG